MGTLGPERIHDRVYRRPPAYTAGSAGTDGRPLDAATMMELQNEAGWLVHESTRHLITSIGPGAPIVYAAANYDGPWDAVPGLAKPAKAFGGDFDPSSKIPWDRQSALRFEGGHVIEDRTNAQGDPLPRAVKIAVQYTTGPDITDGRMYFAMTYSPSPRSVAGCNAAAGTFVEATLALNADGWAEATLAPVAPAPDATTRWRARKSVADGAQVSVTPFWLWVGWRFFGTSNTGTLIHSVSGFEVRD